MHGPDFTCNFPQTVLRRTETDQSQIYPKPLLCFDSHLLVNISRCSSQHLSVISSKHCLCLQLELRPTGTPVRLKNPDYLRLKTQTLPDRSLKNVRWVRENCLINVIDLSSLLLPNLLRFFARYSCTWLHKYLHWDVCLICLHI